VQRRLSEAGFGKLVVDGIVGARTVAVVKAYQAARALAPTGKIEGTLVAALAREPVPGAMPPRVLVVQSGAMPSNMDGTTYVSRSGMALEDYYRRWADVEVVSGQDNDQIVETVRRSTPALVHLVAAIRETSGLVFLDFARRRGGEGSGEISATVLDTLAKQLYAELPRPFLVLDIVRPSSTFDAALALGLRNALASDLLHLGGFSGVLATGLEQPWMLGTLAKAILAGLGRSGTMGALANTIRALFSTAPQTDEETVRDYALAYLGTALFAQDPDLPCMLY